jgi:hypothetical protein
VEDDPPALLFASSLPLSLLSPIDAPEIQSPLKK